MAFLGLQSTLGGLHFPHLAFHVFHTQLFFCHQTAQTRNFAVFFFRKMNSARCGGGAGGCNRAGRNTGQRMFFYWHFAITHKSSPLVACGICRRAGGGRRRAPFVRCAKPFQRIAHGGFFQPFIPFSIGIQGWHKRCCVHKSGSHFKKNGLLIQFLNIPSAVIFWHLPARYQTRFQPILHDALQQA